MTLIPRYDDLPEDRQRQWTAVRHGAGRFAWVAMRALIVCVLSVLATLPWGVSIVTGLSFKFMILGLIVHWALRGGTAVASPAVFLAGLIVDALGNGPLGHWALIFLVGHGIAMMLGPVRGRLGALVSLVVFLVVGGALAGVSWGLVSAFQMGFQSPETHLLAFMYALSAYPFGVILIWLIEPPQPVVGPRGPATASS